jgi:hypothetical protein
VFIRVYVIIGAGCDTVWVVTVGVYDEVWVLVEVRVAEALIVTVGAVGVTDPVFEIDGDGVDVLVLVKVGVRVTVPVRIVG